MKNEKFLELVNDYTIQTLTERKTLRTKADFIDNLLTVENTTALESAMKNITEVKENCRAEYTILHHHINIIKGIESQRFLEVIQPLVSEHQINTDRLHRITELRNQKIDKIKDLANWLFA